ncbi:uncharacterized protein LOC100902978 [Galendromus occidentalis]|uniref:ATP-dependent DNA helicase n=1 Tax=Galendromus occidentalis TaxID=34638 RepID=A0AAJ6QQS0_9ACAR|nr:uncharacterized protein LOC100902978 [Galendromus occidentalis]
MDSQCSACMAAHFQGERTMPGGSAYTTCCAKGKVHVALFERFPPPLRDLFLNQDQDSKSFRQHIRNYNNALAMASMTAKIEPPSGNGPYCFRVHGQVYHRIGGLRPPSGQLPQCAQVLIMDTEQAAQELAGREVNRNCCPNTFGLLHRILNDANPYAQAFKLMAQVADEEAERAQRDGCPGRPVRMVFHQNEHDDQRRYNAATANEVAVVYVGDEEDIPGERLLVVHESTGNLRIISYLDKLCDPLSYPLFFPSGGEGWHPQMERREPTSSRRCRVTQKEYYSYLLFTRDGLFNPLHYAGRLLQQFVVDSWLKIEMNRLNYIRQNQRELRLDTVRGLQDYMLSDPDDSVQPGRRIVLAATFNGGPRYMIAQYQDAMSIVSKYGKPDLFLTFTCNPAWPEITSNLSQGQTASERPDLIARVFQLKVKAFCDEVVRKQVLGEVAAYIYVIEFQKRGLPHMHMLLTLSGDSKLRTPSEVDSLISAELPDPIAAPELYKIVSSCMIHRPCGKHNPSSPCMINGQCSKSFPKNFRDETSLSAEGYPEYRRRQNGRRIICQGVHLDNRFVVPFCPYLTLLFDAHINVELCALLHAVKYLYKYLYKGPDRARIRLQQARLPEEEAHDEIDAYWDTRYVCAPEAIHRIFAFPLNDRSDAVTRLQIHLPGFESVRFEAGTEEAALISARDRFSTLTAFFDKNRRCRDLQEEHGMIPDDLIDSRKLRYHEMPEKFIFKNQRWQERKRGGNRNIGRMYFVSPQDHERFALRLLLLYGTGFTSYEDVRTVSGQTYSSFVEAARASGYLRDDSYSRDALQEASAQNMPRQLRSFFVALITFADIQPPHTVQLWEEYKPNFMEDFIHAGLSTEMAESKAFHDIVQRLSELGRDYYALLPLDIPQFEEIETAVNLEEHRAFGAELYQQLNPEQRVIVDEVLKAIADRRGQCYFVDGPGGSGKTFVYTTIYHLASSKGFKVMNDAWTGIAANLLPEGRTVTSAFRLIVPNNSRSSSIKGQSKEAGLLRSTDVIIWDEAPMAPKTALETIDSLLQDIMKNTAPFGGKTIVLGGDFRQILPVVERGSRGQIVDSCLKYSDLWKHFQQVRLSRNMRLSSDDLTFRQWLHQLGDGMLPADMDIPEDMRCQGNLADVIYGDICAENHGIDFAERTILTPKNAQALKINDYVLNKLAGEKKTFLSEDEAIVEDPSDASHFPTEFLNKMTPATLPPHELNLKTGCIVMLLRNLDVKNGLCNGTRFIVTEILSRVLICSFATGYNRGSSVLIPRIDCYYAHATLPFRLRRRQFPIRLSFCMTINKAQGQSFSRVGIDLQEAIFAHGQLYVALSRATSRGGISIASPNNRMRNIVYDEILR